MIKGRKVYVIPGKGCCKKKLSLGRAKLILLQVFLQKKVHSNNSRNERGFYFCDNCNSFHVTSKKSGYFLSHLEKLYKKKPNYVMIRHLSLADLKEDKLRRYK